MTDKIAFDLGPYDTIEEAFAALKAGLKLFGDSVTSSKKRKLPKETGFWWLPELNIWRAQVLVKGKVKALGDFKKGKDAMRAVKEALDTIGNQ